MNNESSNKVRGNIRFAFFINIILLLFGIATAFFGIILIFIHVSYYVIIFSGITGIIGLIKTEKVGKKLSKNENKLYYSSFISMILPAFFVALYLLHFFGENANGQIYNHIMEWCFIISIVFDVIYGFCFFIGSCKRYMKNVSLLE